jgi:hypothetical protein
MFGACSMSMLGRYIIAAQIGARTIKNSRLDSTGMLRVLKSVPCITC